MTKRRRVLITNLRLNARTGAEIVTKRLAVGLARRGHDVTVYSPLLGEISEEIRKAGVTVTDSIDRIDTEPDIIHGHHTPTTATAVARFPRSPALFVCHDFVAWHDSPPLMPSIHLYLGTTPLHIERMVTEAGVPRAKCALLRNAVDLEAFRPRQKGPDRPARAAVFAKGRRYLAAIREACAKRNIPLDEYGSSVGRPVAAPENVMPDYDLVFASGMTAMEAMACGCGVILCDSRGLAGFCTAENFAGYYDLNFGLRSLTRRIDSDSISTEIEAYSAQAVANCTRKARENLSFERYLDQVVDYHDRIAAGHGAASFDGDAQNLAAARYIEQWSPALQARHFPALREIETLKAEVDRLSIGVAPVAGGVANVLGDGREAAWFKPLFGLGRSEKRGRWTTASVADFVIAVPHRYRQGCTVSMKVRPAHMDKRAPFTVRVAARARLLEDWEFDRKQGGTPKWRDIRIPGSAIGPKGEIHFSLAMSDTFVPADNGVSRDLRELGIAVMEIEIRD